MKYKCIKPCFQNGKIIMDVGHIIVRTDNKIYNVTTKMDYIIDFNINDYIDKFESEEKVANSFEDIVKGMIDTYKRKNHDYGNSFEESLNEEGIAASRIRMGDKWNRFKTLSKVNDIKVNDESIEDTLLDMANYAIMTVMWLRKK